MRRLPVSTAITALVPRLRHALWLTIFAACLTLPLATDKLAMSRAIERAAHDAYRYLLAPQVSIVGGDSDISIVLYDDAVARSTGRTNPIDRALLAKTIKALDDVGAKAIGIDMIFLQETDDQEELISAFRDSKTPIFLAFADPEKDKAEYWDVAIAAEASAYQDELWRTIAGGPVTKVAPVVGIDDVGVVRRWPEVVLDASPPLAAAMAGVDIQAMGYEGSIGFTRLSTEAVEPGVEPAKDMFPAYAMDLLSDPDLAEFFLPELAGRYVLIGGDTFNSDQLSTPITRIADDPKVAGVTVHAHMLRQALDGRFPGMLPLWAVLALAVAFAAMGAVTARIERKPFLLTAIIIIEAGILIGLPVALHHMGIDLLSVPIFGFLLAWLLAFLTIGYALRTQTSTERAFARGALGKFLPEKVASEILDHPEKLELAGEERDLFMLFTDLEGFTRYCHGRSAHESAKILNDYLERMSQVVLDHQGTIDKFVGDAIVAFWGAPIASDQDAHNAVACSVALHAEAETMRAEISDGETSLGRTRIGLHYGKVMVGNFGGKRRIQYTALGDAMNVAARLEGANKYLRSDILLSETVAQRAPDFAYRPLGAIELSGVSTPIEVFEPAGESAVNYTSDVVAAMQKVRAGEADGAAALRALVLENPNDLALAALAERLDDLKGGGAHVLGSK